jgi:hypothetical protein
MRLKSLLKILVNPLRKPEIGPLIMWLRYCEFLSSLPEHNPIVPRAIFFNTHSGDIDTLNSSSLCAVILGAKDGPPDFLSTSNYFNSSLNYFNSSLVSVRKTHKRNTALNLLGHSN